MEQTHKPLDRDPAQPRPLTLTLPNGFLKKHQPQLQQLQLQRTVAVYRECLKNHAASLGAHALDGCGEFIPSPSSNPSDPTSLVCAACGCHRNFHRRLPLHPHSPRRQRQQLQAAEDEDDEDNQQDQDDEMDDGETDENNNNNNSSAPHMLLALSTGVNNPVGTTIQRQSQKQPSGRKRFRTKFSPEQKERMQELSERLGWRMQKRDEALVEERCREIGIGRTVFKVWMHNNKHNFVPSPRSATAASIAVASLSIPNIPPAAAAGADGIAVNIVRVNGSGSGSAAAS